MAMEILIPPHSLTRFQMQKYYQNESKFSGVYSRYNFPEKRKDKDLEDYADVGTHWISFYVSSNKVIYFESFGVEHIPKEI